MRDRGTRIFPTVIIVCIVALIGIGIGMASILRASAIGGNPPSIAQATPAIGVTHV